MTRVQSGRRYHVLSYDPEKDEPVLPNIPKDRSCEHAVEACFGETLRVRALTSQDTAWTVQSVAAPSQQAGTASSQVGLCQLALERTCNLRLPK